MRKLKHSKNAKELAKTVIRLLIPFKNSLKTITTDNGLEFATHEEISKAIGMPIYFADPYASWQKGAIENANGTHKTIYSQIGVFRPYYSSTN